MKNIFRFNCIVSNQNNPPSNKTRKNVCDNRQITTFLTNLKMKLPFRKASKPHKKDYFLQKL